MELRPPRTDRSPDISEQLKASILNSAALTGVCISDLRRAGRGWRFRLTPQATDRTPSGRLRSPALYHRLSAEKPWRDSRQRHINAVCWHGHRDFMTRLFALLPTCTLRTALATYRGREGFEQNYPSQMLPQTYSDLCHCEEDK